MGSIFRSNIVKHLQFDPKNLRNFIYEVTEDVGDCLPSTVVVSEITPDTVLATTLLLLISLEEGGLSRILINTKPGTQLKGAIDISNGADGIWMKYGGIIIDKVCPNLELTKKINVFEQMRYKFVQTTVLPSDTVTLGDLVQFVRPDSNNYSSRVHMEHALKQFIPLVIMSIRKYAE